jgi:chitinase
MGVLSLNKCLLLLPLLSNSVIAAAGESLNSDLATAATGTSGTCSKDKECETGCCSKAGYCGFGPKFCGDDVCISNCDAKAECGRKFQLLMLQDLDAHQAI